MMKKHLNYTSTAETNGTFQFESPGMQKYLRDLKPDKFEDLIAMNALVPAGSDGLYSQLISTANMAAKTYQYDLPEMEEYLEGNLWHHRIPGTGDVAGAEAGRLQQGRCRCICVRQWERNRSRFWIK